jgi:zinc transport system permease protein
VHGTRSARARASFFVFGDVVDGFKRSLAAAVVAGQVATVAGVTLSYLYDVAAGGAIVLVAIAVYAAVEVTARARHRYSVRGRTLGSPTLDAASSRSEGDDRD